MKWPVPLGIIVTLVALLLAPALAAGYSGGILPNTVREAEATCSDGYALWADSMSGSTIMDWSGSDNHVTGNVHSNRDIVLSGSDNVIVGAVEYVTSFEDEGDANVYPFPVQVSTDSMPVTYDISAYQPGGAAATMAQQDGKYEYVDGDFEVSDGNVQLDGLYYVTGKAILSGSDLYGTMTIVAAEEIELSGSDHNFEPYSNGLLLFSDRAGREELAIRISGSNSVLPGIIYAPNAQIEVSGSTDEFAGGLYGHTLKLSGSLLAIVFDADYCPGDTPPPPPGPVRQLLPFLVAG